MATPIQGQPNFELLDRRKGDPINEYFFGKIKVELARATRNGMSKQQIADKHKTSLSSVRLIDKAKNFTSYQRLRFRSSLWRSKKSKGLEKRTRPSRLVHFIKRK